MGGQNEESDANPNTHARITLKILHVGFGDDESKPSSWYPSPPFPNFSSHPQSCSDNRRLNDNKIRSMSGTIFPALKDAPGERFGDAPRGFREQDTAEDQRNSGEV